MGADMFQRTLNKGLPETTELHIVENKNKDQYFFNGLHAQPAFVLLQLTYP